MKAAIRMGTLILALVVAFITGRMTSPVAEDGRGPEDGSRSDIKLRSSENAENLVRDGSKRERIDSRSKTNQTVRMLDALADESPELIGRLNLGFALLDSNLDPNMSNWELLGLDKAAAESVSNGVKDTLRSVRQHEATTFKVVDRSDDRTRIYIPKLDPSAASKYMSEIEGSFAHFFGGELSRQLARSVVQSSPNTAGLVGKDRVISITLTPEDVLTKTKRGYEVRFQVVSENNLSFSDLIQNLDSHTSYDGTTIFQKTPDYLADFIGQTDQ